MGLLVIDPGLSTTVQDAGRWGYRAWGVPVAGAFDSGAATLANALLANPPDAAVLEMTLVGGRYEAATPLALALTGACMDARLIQCEGSTERLRGPLSFAMRPGDRLVLSTSPRGVRAYLGVAGGWSTPVVLGSRSSETRLSAGMILPCSPGSIAVRHPAGAAFSDPTARPIRVVAGPDFARLETRAFEPGVVFQVRPECDRMGLRLEGPAWSVADDPDRVSTPVAPGAVQAAGGQALILGVAGGTMGGYPHVAQVISADLDRLGQIRPGDHVSFARIDLETARRLDRETRALREAWRKRIAAAARDGLG